MTQTQHLVEALAAGGDGLIEVNGKAVFVPGTAPGDTVILDDQGRVQDIQQGPNHAKSRCSHFGTCGGCTLQYLSDDMYAQWLQSTITRKLQQHSLETLILPAAVSPPQTRRRCAVSARWQDGAFVIGFTQEKSHQLVPLSDCAVLDPAVFGLITPLGALLKPYVGKRQTLRATITRASNGIDLLLEGINTDDPQLRQDVAFFAQDHQGICRIIGQERGYEDILFQQDTPIMRFDGGVVALPCGAFTQATPQGEAALIQALRDWIEAPKAIADLFSGVGSLSLALARHAKVDAFEASQPAVHALKNARLAKGRHGIHAIHRDLFRRPLTVAELNKYETIVLDPPRAGAKAQCETLAEGNCGQLLYVSCNPNTFARDARILVDGGYSLESIQPVGQFLWSTHVELAAHFHR
jgi:23S rRNA (uracil1939-C5)-methyltransferase